jgi:hypothetical protein
MAVDNTDITRRIRLTKGGVPVSINSLHEMLVYIYTMVNHRKEVYATFSKTATGEYAIAIDPDDDSYFIIVINRNRNRGRRGQVYAEIAVQATADASYPNSLKNDAKTGIEITVLEPSANPVGLL